MGDKDKVVYPPTDQDFKARVTKATRELVRSDFNNMHGTSPGPISHGLIEDPEFNPEWNSEDSAVPGRRMPLRAREALTNLARMERNTTTTKGVVKESLLDETILRYRQAGLQPGEIARKIGGSMTADGVQERLSRMLKQMSQFSDDEQRMLQMARLESVINMLWGLSEHGSAEHIKLIIEAIDRLSKLLGLEKQTVKTEVMLVTNAQAGLFSAAVEAALNVILSHPALRDRLGENDIDAITGSALLEAANVIEAAQGQTVSMAVANSR